MTAPGGWFPTGLELRAIRAMNRRPEDWPGYLSHAYETHTLDEIAALLAAHGVSVSRDTVSNWLDRMGVARRPNRRPDTTRERSAP